MRMLKSEPAIQSLQDKTEERRGRYRAQPHAATDGLLLKEQPVYGLLAWPGLAGSTQNFKEIQGSGD